MKSALAAALVLIPMAACAPGDADCSDRAGTTTAACAETRAAAATPTRAARLVDVDYGGFVGFSIPSGLYLSQQMGRPPRPASYCLARSAKPAACARKPTYLVSVWPAGTEPPLTRERLGRNLGETLNSLKYTYGSSPFQITVAQERTIGGVRGLEFQARVGDDALRQIGVAVARDGRMVVIEGENPLSGMSQVEQEAAFAALIDGLVFR